MELCDEGLDSFIKKIDQKTAFEYFQQICEGVRHLHIDQKIIHRDLKPGNILLKENLVKICDFGEAKRIEKSNITLSDITRGFGTLEYLPPEIFDAIGDSHKKYNEKTDIWALGIIFHKMLTKNIHPFLQGMKFTEATKVASIKNNLQEKQAKIDPTITDPIFLRILEGCLQKIPKNRLNIIELIDIFKKQLIPFPNPIPNINPIKNNNLDLSPPNKGIKENDACNQTSASDEPSFLQYCGKFCFKLYVPCPGCDKKLFFWNHAPCGSKLYIDQDGYLLCYNLLTSRNCTQKYFIQFSLFKCSNSIHTSCYTKIAQHSDIMMAIGLALKSIQNIPGVDQKQKTRFSKNMCDSIQENWNDEL